MQFKKLIFCLFAIVVFQYSWGQTISIKGDFTNSSAAQKVYLYEFFGSETILKDSTQINQGKFEFSYLKPLPRGFYKVEFSKELAVDIILGTESMTISGDLKNEGNIQISGSKENEIYSRYRKSLASLSAEMQKLDKEANTYASLQASNPPVYQTKIQPLIKRFDSLNKSQQTYYRELLTEDLSLYISKYLGHLLTGSSYTEDNFFSTDFFADEELSRGSLLASKINVYFQNYVARDLQGYQKAAERLLTLSNGRKSQELVYQSLIGVFQAVDMETTRILATNYKKAFPNSATATTIVASMPKGSPQVGDMAPDIVLKTADGKSLALSSLKGKVVLIDFWASWCGPCRQENPNVVRVFNKYKDKGFMIYGVSLDNDRDKWLNAISKDQLTWLHVSDLKGWKSEGAALYSVNSIPATFLLDKEGKIISTNLRGEALEQALQKIYTTKNQ